MEEFCRIEATVQQSQNVTMIATSDTKSDEQSVENSGKFERHSSISKCCYNYD